jgi:hypothetical protein
MSEEDFESILSDKDRQILDLVKFISTLAGRVGEAEGRLAVSQMAGIVEGWMKRAHSAEFLLETTLKENREHAERIEELTRDAENVSAEFEGDCWVAMRGLLDHLGYDWSHGESVTAQEAYDWIAQELWERHTAFGRQIAELKDALRAMERGFVHAVEKIEDAHTLAIIKDARRQGQRLLSTEEAPNG